MRTCTRELPVLPNASSAALASVPSCSGSNSSPASCATEATARLRHSACMHKHGKPPLKPVVAPCQSARWSDMQELLCRSPHLPAGAAAGRLIQPVLVRLLLNRAAHLAAALARPPPPLLAPLQSVPCHVRQVLRWPHWPVLRSISPAALATSMQRKHEEEEVRRRGQGVKRH